MDLLPGLSKKTLISDACWVCGERFKTSVPPGRANREDHHIVPRNAGGTDGPEVSLCDSHHATVHKLAPRLKNRRKYQDLLIGEGTQEMKKLLWLASIIVRSEALVVDDPNKLLRNGVMLNSAETAMMSKLQSMHKGATRSDIFKRALRVLYKQYF